MVRYNRKLCRNYETTFSSVEKMVKLATAFKLLINKFKQTLLYHIFIIVYFEIKRRNQRTLFFHQSEYISKFNLFSIGNTGHNMFTKKTNTITESDLWQKFLNGDDKAYANLYKKYIEALFSYGMRFTSDKELVKDCIQDVFVKIYSNRSNLSRTDNIKLYLFIALKNTLFNVFHKDKSCYHIDTIEPVYSTEYSIEEKMIADEYEQECRDKMIRILDSLTPRQKEVMYYRYVECMEMEEVCRLMNMNYQSVQNLIQRSIKKVKHTFSEKDLPAVSINFISRCL